MYTYPDSYTHDITEQEITIQRAAAVPNLVQLFSLDLARCPHFNRVEEYTLACRTRSSWRSLTDAVIAQQTLLLSRLGLHHLPSSSDALSESDILRVLRALDIYVKRNHSQMTDHDLMSLQTWLAQTQVKLTDFRQYRDEMVRRNLRFVVMLARRYQQSKVSLLDLVQEGALGLMRAVEKFDPQKGVRFASYAVWWIRDAFARVVTTRDNTVCTLYVELGEEHEGSLSLIDLLAAPEETSPEVALLHADTRSGLQRALAALPAQEATILRLRFGLGETPTYTLAEVSQRLGLSREQVRLREQRALTRLRVELQHSTASPPKKAHESRRRWRKAA